MKFHRCHGKRYICIILTCCIFVLILHNSMYSIISSNMQSGFVLNCINRILFQADFNFTLTQFAVRKMAHFIEYFFFGLLLTITFITCTKSRQKSFWTELFLFLAAPAVDETIQLFYYGRNSSVLDIWIDFCGCMAGMGIYYLVCFFSHSK